MSTTTNAIAAATLTAALVGGALMLSPDEATVAPNATVASDGGVVDAGQRAPLVGAFFLRFPDEQAWEAAVRSSPFWQWETALVDAGVDDAGMHRTETVQLDAGSFPMASSGHAIDIVGTISRPLPGDAGVETLEGYHVNFQGVLPQEWEQYLVEPENPVRTWAR